MTKRNNLKAFSPFNSSHIILNYICNNYIYRIHIIYMRIYILGILKANGLWSAMIRIGIILFVKAKEHIKMKLSFISNLEVEN